MDNGLKVAFVALENSMLSNDIEDGYEWNNLWEFQARKRLWSAPHLSLLTLAAMVSHGMEPDYIDLNYDKAIDDGYDWLFFSPSTSQANRAYELSDRLRSRGARVAMGGPHVSMMTDEASKHADVLFVGEAEETFPAFWDELRKGNYLPVYEASRLPDMDLSPIPQYRLAKPYPYKSIPVQTSRGCPHQCSFCISSKLYGKRIRRKSIHRVLRELETVLKYWKRPFIFFTDDNFFLNAGYSETLVNAVGELGISWYAFTDASITNRLHLLESISKSGCTQLLIGFESLESSNLESINNTKWKLKRLESYREIIRRIQSFGIGVVGSFVLGMDGDTPEMFDELYDFIEETCLYATNITVLTPFPGTEIFKTLKDEGRINGYDWSKYTGFELTFRVKNFTAREFEEGFRNLHDRLNSSARINKVINYFKEIMSRRYLNRLREKKKCRIN